MRGKDDQAFQAFEPWVQPYLQCLLEQEKRICLTDQSIQIIEPYTRLINPAYEGRNVKCDRFKLKIPYADQTLTWEVLFDVANMREPPDIIFDAEDNDFVPSLENLNSFVCWDWSNGESLLALIVELLELYRGYQLSRASLNTSMQRHVSSLIVERPANYQIIINKSERGIGTTNLLMQMDVDLSLLPPHLTMGNPGANSAVLQVCIPYPESQTLHTQLYLSPAVEHAFGGSSNLQIPTFKAGVLLGEYVADVNQLLQKQVKKITKGFDKKKDYIAGFMAHFGRSVLEFDSETFSKIVLLLEWHDFFFTFTAELPLYFPVEQPTFVFRSVYHHQKGMPYTEKHSDFPYSPRWDGAEMARRASAYILEVIKAFQMSSVNNADK